MIAVSYKIKAVIEMVDGLPRQKLNRICASQLFAGVDEIVVEQIVTDRRCTFQRFSKGNVIYDALHFQRCLGILLGGRVRMELPASRGRAMKLSVLRPGACFGAAAMFRPREQYAVTLTAEAETEILFLPEEVLQWAMQRNFTVTENYIQYLSDQIWFLHEKLTNLTAGAAERRLALFLTEHCDANGVLRASMIDLCRQMNFGRATVYRAVGALEDQGLVTREKKVLRVVNMEGLKTAAQG